MSTIKEIAERAGVSIGTVDRVLHNRGRVSEQTRQTVLNLIKEMDYQPNNIAKGLAIMRKKRKLTFFITDPADHPFFEQVLAGARQKAKDLLPYGVEVEFIQVPASGSTFDLTDFSTDGIALMQLPASGRICRWAEERNIPVVYYNTPALDDYCLAYVGCDYFQAGRIAAGMCSIACGGAGKAGILSEGDDRTFSYHQRETGFRQEMSERYPDMKIMPSYLPRKGETLEDAANRMLDAHPDLDIVYLVNPGNYSICRLLHGANENKPIKIITNDLTGSQRIYLENGIITATVCQEPERQGSQALEVLFEYIVNKQTPPERKLLTNLTIHISQNI